MTIGPEHRSQTISIDGFIGAAAVGHVHVACVDVAESCGMLLVDQRQLQLSPSPARQYDVRHWLIV